MYKLCFFVPKAHLETVKEALFSIGAGKIGAYDSCCWQTEGIGQFRPLDGSQPYIGQPGQVEQVVESKVEMVCEDGLIQQAVDTLKKAHPYEEVAYDVIRLESI
ncbi:MAG: YqfO family protein [Motiliproteus sp.]